MEMDTWIWRAWRTDVEYSTWDLRVVKYPSQLLKEISGLALRSLKALIVMHLFEIHRGRCTIELVKVK